MATETITIGWSDLKDRLRKTLIEGKPWDQSMAGDLLAMHRSPYTDNEWKGGRGADLMQWLREGFRAPELAASASAVTTEPKARAMWSEEDGDVDPGRLYGGYDDFYFTVAEREAKPGLTIRADLFFSAMVSARTVRAYGAFVAGLIGALEAQGIDLEVELVMPVRQLYTGASERARQDVRIKVKQLGELSDFTEWSACFSPMGTRVVGFTGFGVASEQVGQKMTSFCAMSLDSRERSWGVTYDADANVLEITADQRARGEFPAERMTTALKEAGLI